MKDLLPMVQRQAEGTQVDGGRGSEGTQVNGRGSEGTQVDGGDLKERRGGWRKRI